MAWAGRLSRGAGALLDGPVAINQAVGQVPGRGLYGELRALKKLVSKSAELKRRFDSMCNDFEQHVAWKAYCQMVQLLEWGVPARQSEADLQQAVDVGITDLATVMRAAGKDVELAPTSFGFPSATSLRSHAWNGPPIGSPNLGRGRSWTEHSDGVLIAPTKANVPPSGDAKLSERRVAGSPSGPTSLIIPIAS